MSKFFTYVCTSLLTYSAIALNADAPMDSEVTEFSQMEPIQFPIEEAAHAPAPAVPLIVEEPRVVAPKKVVDKTPEVDVKPFTGKIKGRKVRMRLRPDLDSRIIKELVKNDMVTVVGEKGDFWAVQPPAGTKAYVFRSFILDNVVEGNRVNVRLEPSLDAPVLTHLNAGEKLENPSIAAVNPKWFEISAPAQTRFYVAKEYIEYAGGPEVKAQMDRRLANAEQLLDTTSALSKTELRKPFEEIDFDRIVKGYNTVINDFSDFADLAEQAKEALAVFQETYLQKRISYMESQPVAKQTGKGSLKKEVFENIAHITDKMKAWDEIEESLYLSWTGINENKSQQDYYEEQKLASVELSGIIEAYQTHANHKPGDYRLCEKGTPVAFIYSNKVNLENLVGKQVRLVAAPRPSNNFALPAYYVITVE